jgi:hypothetical protein
MKRKLIDLDENVLIEVQVLAARAKTDPKNYIQDLIKDHVENQSEAVYLKMIIKEVADLVDRWAALTDEEKTYIENDSNISFDQLAVGFEIYVKNKNVVL